MKTDKFLTIAATALMLAACSNEDAPQADALKDTPITVTAGVEGMNTRAGHDADNLPAKFYLTVTQTEEASQYNYTNVEMTKGSGSDYTPSTNLLWKDAIRSPFVSAYTIEGTAFTVQTDQSTAESVIASDLLGAVSTTEGDVTISGDNISIRFRHLLCKLDVTFSWGTELATATTKTIKSVEYQGFGTDVTLNRSTCIVTNGTATADIRALVGNNFSEAIFAPHVGTAPKIVITTEITTGTGDAAVTAERVFSINVTAPTGGFASGNRYTMNVTIGGTSVEDGSVTANLANGWGDAIEGNMATN